jgi:hypothetical protein
MKAITAEGNSNVRYNLNKHLTSDPHKEKCLRVVTPAESNEFVASAEEELRPIAIIVAKAATSPENRDSTKQFLARFLMPCSDFWYCTICDSFVAKKGNHKKHPAAMKKKPAHQPVNVSGSSRIIPPDYNPFDAATYSKLFRKLLITAKSDLDCCAGSHSQGINCENIARRSSAVDDVLQSGAMIHSARNKYASVPPAKKQRTSSVETFLSTAVLPNYAPPSHEQLQPRLYFHVPRNTVPMPLTYPPISTPPWFFPGGYPTPFQQPQPPQPQQYPGAPSGRFINQHFPACAPVGAVTYHPERQLKMIFGFTPKEKGKI